MFNNLFSYIRSCVLASYGAKKSIYKLLSSSLFTKNPFYSYLFYKDIQQKIRRIKQRPLAVIIENTNHCNISCIFCANEKMQRKRGFITADLFRKIIDQCSLHKVSNVVIQGFGEPLLDKDYVSKVVYAKEKGIANVHCVTNGILLNQNIAEALIKARLDYLDISIDAATPEVYGEIHRVPLTGMSSNKFFAVRENIDNLLALKRKYGSKKPMIEVRFKDFDKNKSDLAHFIKMYKNSVDKITLYMNITNWPGSDIKNNLPKAKPLKFPCYNLWSTLFITYDGRVALCCQDYECRHQLGDINREDIMDIWNGSLLAKMRQLHLNSEFNRINVCNDCVINTHYVTCWWP